MKSKVCFKWKWAVIPAILIVLIVIVLGAPTSQNQGVSVTFLSFTNRSLGKVRIALFVVSNECNRAIHWNVTGAQVKSNGVWFTPMRVFFSSSGEIGLAGDPPDHWRTSGDLKPREWTVAAVRVPEQSNVWRGAVVSWESGKVNLLRARLTANVEAVRKRLPLPGFHPAYLTFDQLHAQTNYSDGITYEGSQPDPVSSP